MVLFTAEAVCGDGLTVITHGYRFTGSFPSWPIDMANEIVTRREGGKVIRLYFDSGTATVITGAGEPDALAASGETVLVLDWSGKSNNIDAFLNAEAGWREAAGDFLANFLLGTGLVQSANSTGAPIHFVGHSYGAVVNSEAIRRLWHHGIEVDQMTTLDPHDQNQDGIPDAVTDPRVRVWPNVLFADNYWEDNAGAPNDPTDNDTPTGILLPVGHYLWSAANRDLTEETAPAFSDWFAWEPHFRVHEWYYKTIGGTDEPGGSAGGQFQADRGWYTPLQPVEQGYALTDLHRIMSINFPSFRMTAPEAEPGVPPPTLEWDSLESVFNGDFRFSNFDSGADSLPGFANLNGAIIAPVGAGDYAALVKVSNSSIETQLTYVAPTASALQFKLYMPDIGFLLGMEAVEVQVDGVALLSIPYRQNTPLDSTNSVNVSPFQGRAVKFSS